MSSHVACNRSGKWYLYSVFEQPEQPEQPEAECCAAKASRPAPASGAPVWGQSHCACGPASLVPPAPTLSKLDITFSVCYWSQKKNWVCTFTSACSTHQSHVKCTVTESFIGCTRVGVTASTFLQHHKQSMGGCRADVAPHNVDWVKMHLLCNDFILF